MLAGFFARALGWESDRLDTRSAVYKRLPLFQSGPPIHISSQGSASIFRFAPPWAEVSYAFGVPPENAPIAELFTLYRYVSLERIQSGKEILVRTVAMPGKL